MTTARYWDFDLAITPYGGENYLARVVSSPVGETGAEFAHPVFDLEPSLILRISRHISTRYFATPAIEMARTLGKRLFETVFSGEVGACFHQSSAYASRSEAGLRIKLRLTEAPELAHLPWEYLYDPAAESFLALSVRTSLIRYVTLPSPSRPLIVSPPLRILTAIASPRDLPVLDVEQERARVTAALDPLVQQGLVSLMSVERATQKDLQWQLRQEEYHIFHFIGHNLFDEQTQEGVLILEDNDGLSHPVTMQFLGMMLRDQSSLRLAILDACEGPRPSLGAPFTSMAQGLLQRGISAVVAMQFELTDEVSSLLSREFYHGVVHGYPVDIALSDARRAIFLAFGDHLEWGAPILYLHTPDGQLFDLVTEKAIQESETRRLATERERIQLVRQINRRLDLVIAELPKYETLERIASVQRELDWLPTSLSSDLDLDVVEILPGLMAIAQGISSLNQIDLYGCRLGIRNALNELDQLRRRLPVLGQRAQRWERVLNTWQRIFIDELNRLESEIEPVIIVNPYQAGNPLVLSRKALFKGRRDLRDSVVNALYERTRPTLILRGSRRMGKTSFLLQLPSLLPGRTIPVFVDMQKPSNRANDSAFLLGLAQAIGQSAKPYRVILPEPDHVEFDRFPFQAFGQWLDELVLPKLRDFDILIAFDEFEKFGQAIADATLSKQVLDELRYTIQHRTKIALLFAGVRTLDELGPDWSSYFINVRVLSISYLSRKDAVELIRNPDPEVEFNLAYDDEAVEHILANTLGHPHLVQLVCHCIVEEANAHQTLHADVYLVEAGERLALERGAPYFRNVWDVMAGPDGQPLLRRIAAAPGPFLLETDESPVKQALERMVRLQVLKRTADGYTVEVPLIRRWVNECAPA